MTADGDRPPIPEPKVPLFGSGAEAADHGQRDIDDPPPETTAKAEKLLSKYPRLEWS